VNFQDYLDKNKGRAYQDILQEIFDFEDHAVFKEWAHGQRLTEFNGNDWGMLAISLLNDKIKALEQELKLKENKK
jgi:hypothetical protein